MERYYLELGREDYYLHGGEPPGIWYGNAAEKLALTGTVSKEDLKSLFRGFSPAGQTLVQNAGKMARKPGWDLTFSAPKSVSVLWSQSTGDTRKAIQEAHLRAVKQALDYLERVAAVTRTGKGGVDLQPATLVVAMFEHGTSRAQDPQLHTHTLVINAALRQDGRWGALRSKDFYDHKMTAGAIYRVALAHRLRHELGVNPIKKETWFELKGVPQKVIDAFSKRREEIERVRAQRNLSGAAAAQLVALETRQVKQHAARSELLGLWQSLAGELGFGPQQARQLLGEKRRVQQRREDLRATQTVRSAIHTLTGFQSVFSEREVLRAAAETLQSGRVSLAALLGAVTTELRREGEILILGREDGHNLYTTKELYDLERRILQSARATQSDLSHTLDDKLVANVLKSCGLDGGASKSNGVRTAQENVREFLGLDGTSLNAEQQAAVHHLTTKPGSIQCLAGYAGTGKTRTLRAARKAWEKAGFRVVGAALAGAAARKLEDDTGIKSETVRKTLDQLQPSLPDQIQHHGRQVWKAARKKKTHKIERLKLDRKTVLVVDEAAMLDTRSFAELMGHASRTGSKLVFVGDEFQLPSIEAGCPFAQLMSDLNGFRMTRIMRQREEWQRTATVEFARGDAKSALSLYAERGFVHVRDNDDEAMNTLIDTWQRQRTRDLKETFILAGTRREADQLNRLAQEQRRQRGELGWRAVRVRDTRFRTKDRVMLTKTTARSASETAIWASSRRSSFQSSITSPP